MAGINPSRNRLRSIFPPGFDSVPAVSDSTSYSKHYAHSTEQMKELLVNDYNCMNPSDSIVVKSAWYGKQTSAAKHEFILIHVEDKNEMSAGDQPLLNYLVLDRNATVTAKQTRLRKALKQSQTTSQSTQPNDAFRVSHDGDWDRLAKGCDLSPNRMLEKLEFSTNRPLYLYELAVLADVVSAQNPNYHAIRANCYLFAGLIWDSLCELYPDAAHDKTFAWERGKNTLYEFTVSASQVKDTCQCALDKMVEAREIIKVKKAVSFIHTVDSKPAHSVNGIYKELDAMVRHRYHMAAGKHDGVAMAPIQGPVT